MNKEEKSYRNSKKAAVDAVIVSRARHLADNKSRDKDISAEDKEKYKYIAKKLSQEKVENLVKAVDYADETNDRVSVDIADDKGFTKSVTVDFDKEDGHMSLHVIRGSHKLLDKNREGRQKSTGYGENDKFIKDNTKKDVKVLASDKFEKEKKKVSLKENEFSDDLNAIYGETSVRKEDLKKNFRYLDAEENFVKLFESAFEELPLRRNIEDCINCKSPFSDVLTAIKDVRYGFIDKNTGEKYLDREWIHNVPNLSRYYKVENDPEVTLKNKLGICTDQCIATKHLFTKMHPDVKTQMYALMKGRFGHCVIGFCNNLDNKWYYLENAWDKQRGLHGPFVNQDALEDYFRGVYYNAHKDDNDDPVIVKKYEDYISLTENIAYYSFIKLRY